MNKLRFLYLVVMIFIILILPSANIAGQTPDDGVVGEPVFATRTAPLESGSPAVIQSGGTFPEHIQQEIDEVIRLTNELRDSLGVTCLAVSSQLTEAARAHSQDMVDNNFFDHTGSDGSNPGDRITRTSYPWYTFGENIAAGNSSGAATYNQWFNSQGHYNNMVNASFNEIGVARVDGATYGYYWTMVLASRHGVGPRALQPGKDHSCADKFSG